MATLLEAVTGSPLDRLDKALLCLRAEHRYAGVPCGIMDPFISIFARKDQMLLLDCRSHRSQEISFAEPSISILIFSTNVRHELSRSEYPLRRAQCEEAARELGVHSLREVTPERLQEPKSDLKPVNFRRARHVVTEMARIQQAAGALRDGRWSDAGAAMYASHESLRTDFDVSCSELDTVIDIARNIGISGGVFGSRMTGGAAAVARSPSSKPRQRTVSQHSCATNIANASASLPCCSLRALPPAPVFFTNDSSEPAPAAPTFQCTHRRVGVRLASTHAAPLARRGCRTTRLPAAA